MNHERHERHEKKKGLTPELRFPEFQNAEEWEEIEFKNLIEIIKERAGTKKYTLMSVTAGVGLVSQLEKFGREIAGNAYKNYYVIKKGDFAYNKSATKQFPEGYIAMLTEYDKAALPNSIFTCFRITNENTCSKFFDHLFHANYHGPWLRKFIAIGARAHGSLNIDTKHLLDMPVVLPTLPEQQKIADCLTSLDDLISAEARKLDALRSHKTGLMQQLFPAEGDTLPALRFPEFQDAGEWEEKQLDDALSLVVRKRKKPIDSYTGLGLRSHGKGTFLKYLENPKKNAMEYLYEVQSDDLVVNITFAWEAAIAIAKQTDAGALVSHRFPTYTFKKNVAIPEFFQYIILDKQFIYKLGVISPGGAGRNRVLNKNDFLKLTTLLPGINEQQKIADCLIALDDLITAQADNIDTLKTHKTGLMQQLFPAAETL